jgi:autotransporter-associated beta strand protein
MKKTPNRFFAPLALLSLVSLSSVAHGAVDNFWTGTEDGNWNNPANWSLNRVPTNATGLPEPANQDDAVINDVSVNVPLISGPIPVPRDIKIGYAAGTSGRVDHTAGEVSTAGWTFIGSFGGTGVYNLGLSSGTLGPNSGLGQGSGSLTTGNLFVGGRNDNAGNGNGTFNMNTTGVVLASELYVGNGSGGASGTPGVGVFNLDSGTLVTNSWTMIGRQGGTGTFNMSGGTLQKTGGGNLIVGDSAGGQGSFNHTGGNVALATGELWIGQGGGGTRGVYNLGGEGVVTVDNWIAVGRDGGVGVLNMDGGTLTKTGGGNLVLGTGATGSGTINQSGGLLNLISGDTWVGEDAFGGPGTGVYTLSGSGVANLGVLRIGHNGAATGTFNLNGGQLNVSSIQSGSTGSRTFNFNGGTLNPTGDSTNFLDLGDGGLINVRNGGARIDTGGFTVSINRGLTHSSINGDSLLDGGLNKGGAGTLILNGVSTYTGITLVSAGSLLVNGSLDSILAVVNSGATLGGDGRFGGDVITFGTIAPGAATGIGDFEIGGNLTFGGDSTLAVRVSPMDLGFDRITLGGSLNIDPTTSLALSLFGSDQSLALGSKFVVIDYEGTWDGNTFAGYEDGAAVTFGMNQWLVDYNDPALGGTAFTFTVIPEPGVALLSLAGFGLLLRRKRPQ